MTTTSVLSDAVPKYDADFYSDGFIRDPHPHYAAMRALGPVVWLPEQGNYAVTRYDEVREALRNVQVFSSSRGVAGDQVGCDFMKGNTVASDPPVHGVMRTAMAEPLLPGALEKIRGQIEATADTLIAELVLRRRFDGVEDLARHLPLTIVTELVGLPEDGRENMLKWAAAAFDILGVQNERGRQGIGTNSDREAGRPASTNSPRPAAFHPSCVRSLYATISTRAWTQQYPRPASSFTSLDKTPTSGRR
jgi:cytochrome P450